MKNILFMLIGLMAGFFLAAILLIVTRLPAGQPVTLEPAPTKSPIIVQVIGQVVKPGVYSFPDGSRVQDAVEAAGGLLTDANTDSLNLAARLQDGQQVIIPSGSGSGTPSLGGGIGSGSPISTPTAPFTVMQTLTPMPTTQANLVNINTATIDQLETLPGIGPVTAQSIVTYRQQHGPFQHIEDIMNVPGIGPATFDQISNLITVGS